MKSRSYTCTRCRKDIKSISGFTRHINASKIPITLSSCQPSKLAAIFEYNTTNPPNLLSDNNKEDICPGASKNGDKKIKLGPVDTTDSNNDGDIDQQSLSTPD